MRKLISILRLIVLVSWSIFCILVTPIFLLFILNKKATLILASKLWAPTSLKILGAKTEIEGLDNISNDETYVIMVNHSSYLDIPVLFYSLPILIHFIGKKELKKVPFLGAFMGLSGMIFIDRKNAKKANESIISAAKLVSKGKNIVIFPEGTTSEDGKIAAFKRGGFKLAELSKSTILPIKIEGTAEVWPCTTNLNIRSGHVKIKVGEPIPHSEDMSMLSKMRDVRELIVNL